MPRFAVLLAAAAAILAQASGQTTKLPWVPNPRGPLATGCPTPRITLAVGA